MIRNIREPDGEPNCSKPSDRCARSVRHDRPDDSLPLRRGRRPSAQTPAQTGQGKQYAHKPYGKVPASLRAATGVPSALPAPLPTSASDRMHPRGRFPQCSATHAATALVDAEAIGDGVHAEKPMAEVSAARRSAGHDPSPAPRYVSGHHRWLVACQHGWGGGLRAWAKRPVHAMPRARRADQTIEVWFHIIAAIGSTVGR